MMRYNLLDSELYIPTTTEPGDQAVTKPESGNQTVTAPVISETLESIISNKKYNKIAEILKRLIGRK